MVGSLVVISPKALWMVFPFFSFIFIFRKTINWNLIIFIVTDFLSIICPKIFHFSSFFFCRRIIGNTTVRTTLSNYTRKNYEPTYQSLIEVKKLFLIKISPHKCLSLSLSLSLSLNLFWKLASENHYNV